MGCRESTAAQYVVTPSTAQDSQPVRASSDVHDEAPCLTVHHRSHLYNLVGICNFLNAGLIANITLFEG